MAEIFSPEETRRYARHLALKGIGGQGQQRLKAARVLVIGAGGLGSPVITYLAAAGVGTLGVVDDDRVALSNLQRQTVHGTASIDRPKTESAGAFVGNLNPHVSYISHPVRLSPDNAGMLMSGYDLVVDGSDSFATRLAVADAAADAEIALVSGAVSMFDGQVTVFMAHQSRRNGEPNPGIRDLYPEAPDEADLPSCEVNGVLGPLTGVIGTLMAMEAIKLITRIGDPLVGRLMLYDGRAARFTELGY